MPRKPGVTKGADLKGASVCIQTGTTGEANIADFFRRNNSTFKPVVIETSAELLKAFAAGRCDVFTRDASDLAIKRTELPKPDDYVLLPERISKEPLVAAVRGGDDQWREIVNWVAYATIAAEEFGITQANVDGFADSEDPDIASSEVSATCPPPNKNARGRRRSSVGAWILGESPLWVRRPRGRVREDGAEPNTPRRTG